MNEQTTPPGSPGRKSGFTEQIGRHEARKLNARSAKPKAFWMGFGIVGLIGWGVTIPSLIGLGCGVWIDSHYHGMHCWTLMLFAAGLFLGCLNAWYWISKEVEAIRRDQDSKHKNEKKERKKNE